MLELASGILVAVLILVRFGGVHVLAALLFGGLLIPTAVALAHYFRLAPADIALGMLAAAVVIGSISREAREDQKQEGRRT